MIRSQRRLHRTGFVLLALAVPVVFVSGLRARSTMLDGEPYAGASVVGGVELEHPFAALSDGRLTILLPRDWNEPDVLVYATDDEDAFAGGDVAPEDLPRSARLVGALVPGRSLAWTVGKGARFVLLYSLAHQRILLLQAVGGGA